MITCPFMLPSTCHTGGRSPDRGPSRCPPAGRTPPCSGPSTAGAGPTFTPTNPSGDKTPRRRIPVRSSLNDISTDQLCNRHSVFCLLRFSYTHDNCSDELIQTFSFLAFPSVCISQVFSTFILTCSIPLLWFSLILSFLNFCYFLFVPKILHNYSGCHSLFFVPFGWVSNVARMQDQTQDLRLFKPARQRQH